MRKGRRSAERLSYWPELGSRALPAPAGVNDAANKGSVDAAGDECRRGVVCLQGGRHQAGDTMTGPLTLPAETPLV